MKEYLEKLDDLWPIDYGLNTKDTMVASLVKWYLMVCPGEPARRVMSWLMKPKTTMQIQHETVSVTREGSGVSFLLLPKTEVSVNRKDLATFVDFASGLMKDDLMEKNEAAPARDESADLMSALVEGLDGVDGNQLTNGCSIGLFDFLYNCYRIVVDGTKSAGRKNL
ncbi:MAG: hypothetical protein LUF27_01225 [Lachnospiraceae bacterium]|nr:hypothetical protein [Lachnospiraceae bacterium]